MISGYPTVVLLDAAPRPYAYLVDYESGEGVDRYVSRIAAARVAYLGFVEEEGEPAAPAAFAAALAGVARSFDADEGRDDAFVKDYSDEVDWVLSSVPSSDDNRALIDQRRMAQAAREQRDEVWRPIGERLAELTTEEDWEGVVAYVNQTLSTLDDPVLGERLERRLLWPYEQLED